MVSKPRRLKLCTICGGNGAETSIVPPAARMRHHDAARQEMQPVLQAAREFPILDVEIFGIADDRMAHMGGVRPQLMGAPGDRLHRQPGELLGRRLHDRVIGDGMHRALVAMGAMRMRLSRSLTSSFERKVEILPCLTRGTPATSAQ